MTEPWPRGALPFDIRDLPVECNDQRVQLRHLVDRGAGHRPLDARWVWLFYDSQPWHQECTHTEQYQGLRPKPGPNPDKALEKKPIEFFECIGHRLRVADCPNIGFPELDEVFSAFECPMTFQGEHGASTWSKDITLVDTNGAHSAGFIVCSDCANRSCVNRNYCIWKHERLIPLCRDCCENPDARPLSYQYDSTRPSLHDNILKLTRSEADVFECTCFTDHSPAKGFHLCSNCSSSLDGFYNIRLYNMMRVNMFPSSEQAEVYEADREEVFGPGRNICVCGKSWGELLASWIPLSHEERDRKVYRMCLMCTGHVPRSRIVTTRRTNSI